MSPLSHKWKGVKILKLDESHSRKNCTGRRVQLKVPESHRPDPFARVALSLYTVILQWAIRYEKNRSFGEEISSVIAI